MSIPRRLIDAVRIACLAAAMASAPSFLIAAPAAAETPAAAKAIEATLGKHIHFRLDGARLAARWSGEANVAQEQITVRRPTAKLIVQSAGLVRIGRGDMTFATVTRQGVAGGPAGYYQLQVPKAGGGFSISGQNLYTPTAGVYGMQLSSDGKRIRVSITRTTQTGFGRSMRAVLTTVVRDFRQLAADQPAEVRTFVAPALLELTGIDCFPPDAGDVYRAFADLKPDDAAADALTRLLPALDAESFADRDRAARDLAALGQAGVHAALRADRRGLTPTQRTALDGFVASRTLDPRRTPAEARRDPEFLLQCAAFPDPAVRKSAAAALDALAGRPVKLDLSGAADPVAALADARAALLDVIYPGAKIDVNVPDPDQSRAYSFGGFDQAAQREQVRQLRAMERQNLERWPMGKTYQLSDLLDIRRVNGLPKVRWTKALTVNTPTRVGIEGARGQWLVQRAGEFRKGNTDVSMTWSDISRDGDEGPWRINLNFSNDYFAIHANYGENASVNSVSINIANGRITCTVGRNGVGRGAVQMRGETFRGLAAQHPELVRKYIAPILHDLFGVYFAAPEPGVLYSVFTELPAEESVERELKAIVPLLDVDDAADREAAQERLYGLGVPGVIAVLHFDGAGLTFEQNNRLNAFLASHGWRGDEEAKALRSDVSFLIACLESDDLPARRAAIRALEEKVGPVEFNVEADADARAQAAEALRQRLQPPAPAPTTAPATAPAAK